MPAYRRHLILSTATLTASLIGLTALNVLADPDDVFAGVSLASLDRYRHHRSRQAKAEALLRGGWETVIVGTSRAEAGLDPADWGPRTYNAGLRGGNLHEENLVAELALARTEARTLLFCVDLLGLASGDASRHDLSTSRFDPQLSPFEYWVSSLVGRATTERSWRVLVAASRDEPGANRPDGLRRVPATDAAPNHRPLFAKVLTGSFIVSSYNAFAYDGQRVKRLGLVAASARQRGVRLIVLIPPVHALQLECMRITGVWGDFERLKRDLVAVAEAANALAAPGPPVTVWDFTGYTGPLAEEVPAADAPDVRMTWFFESSHFTPALGRRVLARVRGDPGDEALGARLDAAGLEAHLDRLRADREAWASAHPQELAWLAGVFAQAAQQREVVARRTRALRSAGQPAEE